jgi:hypothetical protein
MLTVYVKHYLTLDGILFFKQQWFPKVFKIASQQKGFISLETTQNKTHSDCVDITLKFQDAAALNDWVEDPHHDRLINELDPYRSRNYWEAVATEDTQKDPSQLTWDVIKI